MKAVIIAIAFIIGLALVIAASIRSLQLDREREAQARQECLDMGGQPLLQYSWNSHAFYLTGCKLDPVRR